MKRFRVSIAALLVFLAALAAAQATPNILWMRTAIASPMHALDFSPDGTTIVSGTQGSFRAWGVAEGALLGTFTSPNTYLLSGLAFSPDGSKVYSASFDVNIQSWAAAGAQLQSTTWANPWSNVGVSPDGTLLASGTPMSPWVRVRRESDGAVLQTLLGHSGVVRWVEFSPGEDQRLASVADDGRAIVWQLPAGSPIRVFDAHVGIARALAFSPDGTRLATCGNDGFVRVWDIESGVLLGTCVGHTAQVASVAFTPDGQFLGTAGADNTVRIWSTRNFALLRTFTGEMGTGPVSLQFSPDGRRFAYGRRDGVLVMAATPRLPQWVKVGG